MDFTVENQFKLYLKRSGLDKLQMTELQMRETKRAFYGGFGQSLIQAKEDLSKLSIKESNNILNSQVQEINSYWLNEANKI